MHSYYDEFQELLEIYCKNLPKPDPEWRDEVQRVVPVIHRHLFDPKLTIGWMREQCHINGKSFPVWFRMYLGRYPKDYIIHHRIEASKLLLQKTGATVTQIALAVGFSSLSAFCNTFKHQEGMRPSKWREQRQN